MNTYNITNKNKQFSSTSDFDYDGEDIELLSSADNYFKLIIKNFDNKIGKNILEVGAGSGNLTSWLRKLYPESNITAIEPSEKMTNVLKSKNLENVDVKKAFLKDLENDFINKFDTIIYNNVLEHIEDDQSEIELVYKILKKGGHILSYNPALQSLYDHHDFSVGHYRRYSKKDLVNKHKVAGFNIIKSKYHDMLGAILMFIKYKVLKKTEVKAGNANLYFNNVLPVVDLIEKKLPVFFGKNLFVIGRKD
jgi:2-polyprenyl-3-methyl-5-hydroxy-6-metoxy-1,4-benzoquinol methylase